MGKFTTTGNDQAAAVISGTFTATGQSSTMALSGYFNVSLWGTFVGTVELDRTFDGGTTWLPCALDALGTSASWTSAVSVVVLEPEPGVLYRLNCTAYTSGTVNYRVSSGAGSGVGLR